MSIAPEYPAAWRDLSRELTTRQISGLEAIERDLDGGEVRRGGDELSDFEKASLLVRLARKDVVSNVWAVMLAEVKPPAGAVPADWEGDGPHRAVFGADRCIDGHRAEVQTTAFQLADGRVDDGSLVEAPTVTVADAVDLSSRQAREVAAALLQAADEIDGWAL